MPLSTRGIRNDVVAGKLWLEITNLNLEKHVDLDAEISGATFQSDKGETLTAAAVDSANTFAAPAL